MSRPYSTEGKPGFSDVEAKKRTDRTCFQDYLDWAQPLLTLDTNAPSNLISEILDTLSLNQVVLPETMRA